MKVLSGVLLLDKPTGPTSHDVVDEIRKVAGIRRVGHVGTLDPFASGLLVLLLGPATRLAEYLVGLDKAYEATVRLGVETDTGDPEGEVVRRDEVGWAGLTTQDIRAALEGLTGRILQTPPVYSAKKVAGEAAHRRVRRGEAVRLDPVEVTVHEIVVLEEALPQLRLRVRCSSGTYVRALATDLGRTLGVGGHLSALNRLLVGPFSVDGAVSPAKLRSREALEERLISPADGLAAYPAVHLTLEEAHRARQGQFLQVRWVDLPEGSPVRMLSEGNLLGIGFRSKDRLRPRKVLSDG